MRWTKIDETTRPDHFYLEEGDSCYHLREYFARKGYQGGETNQLILNLKIAPSVATANQKRGYWKEQAITRCAADLRGSMSREVVEKVTWVPVPPSSAVGEPDYDDRLLRVLRRAFGGYNVDIRELLRQRESTIPDHKANDRISMDALRDILAIDHAVVEARPLGERIVLFDDVLTSGKHFKCCEYRIREALPDGPPVVGMFIARSVRSSPFEEFAALDDQ